MLLLVLDGNFAKGYNHVHLDVIYHHCTWDDDSGGGDDENDVDDDEGGWYVTGIYLKLNDAAIDATSATAAVGEKDNDHVEYIQ